MNFDKTGFILYVNKYKECVDFYQTILQLDIHFSNDMLTCFKFGESYLMVEEDDSSLPDASEGTRIKTCLRMNVSDVKSLAERLTNKNVKVDYQEHDWGTVAKFFDPDGNLCAFKDSEKFEEQMNSH